MTAEYQAQTTGHQALDPDARGALEAVRAEVGKAIIGQDPVLTGLVICLLCRGHVLLEGVPGLALHGHLPLLHGLEQRGLRLRRCPVDLVGEQQVGEHRALTELE